MSEKEKLKGKSYIIIGRPDEGKSRWNMAKAQSFRNKIIFDEYDDYDKKEWTVFSDFDIFRDYIRNVKKCFVSVEEATALVSFGKDVELVRSFIRIVHNGNIMTILFHSIADVPTYLLRNCSYIILFRTNDDIYTIERDKYRRFLAPYMSKCKAANPNMKISGIPVIIDRYK